MTNLDYLEKMKKDDGDTYIEKADWVYRKLKALEIIAEELCKYTIREEYKYSGEYCEQSHDHTG